MNYTDTFNKAVETGRKAKNPKQLLKCVKLLMSIAEYHPQAGFELYVILKNVFSDMEKACFYLKLSADLGFPRAHVKLGEHLVNGIYFEKNEALALQLLMPYADTVPYAANAVGATYINGEQTPHDMKKGMEYLLKSSQMGFAQASYNIALICMGTTGHPKDENKALGWLTTAANQGSGDACFLAACIYNDRSDIRNAYNFSKQGAKLGHAKCIEGYNALHDALFGSSVPTSASGIMQSSENECEYAYTGHADIIREYNEEKQREAERRAANHDTLIAAATAAGGGYVDDYTGTVFGRDGNIYYADADTHTIISENGWMFFDDKTKTLYSNNDAYYFDNEMMSMYDRQFNKIRHVDKYNY